MKKVGNRKKILAFILSILMIVALLPMNGMRVYAVGCAHCCGTGKICSMRLEFYKFDINDDPCDIVLTIENQYYCESHFMDADQNCPYCSGEECKHKWEYMYEADDDGIYYHYGQCLECEKIAPDDWGKCNTDGSNGECSYCGYKSDHIHTLGTLHTAVPATCTKDGSIEYYNCKDCSIKLDVDSNILSSEDIIILALEHSYGEWSDGTHACTRSGCTATETCTHNGAANSTCSVCGKEGIVYFTAVAGVPIGNEGKFYTNLFDSNKNTKWCCTYDSSSTYIVTKASEPVRITDYVITTANDADYYTGRNPKSWTLEACNDYNEETGSGTWVQIDEVADGEMPINKNEAKTYSITDSQIEYRYYKWRVNSTCGEEILQVSEFGLIYYKVEIKPLTFTAKEADSEVALSWKEGSNVKYSLDGGKEWNDYVKGTTITLQNVGDTVSFKGENVITNGENHFLITGKVAASGDVTSLTNGVGGDVALTDSCYKYMFFKCDGLVSAPGLPATTLAKECYLYMFGSCMNLTAAPELPATTLAERCYCEMFDNCISLNKAPELPAETLAKGCYSSMFNGCYSLVNAPELPAKVMAVGCYGAMFQDCWALTTVPELKPTSLEDLCFTGMFAGCYCLKIEETENEEDATWIFPEGGAGNYNVGMIDYLDIEGDFDSVSAGKMYKITESDKRCGDKAFYRYNVSDKTLTIGGTGAIYDGAFSSLNYKNNNSKRITIGSEVEKVVIEGGITSISNNAFSSCKKLQKIELPDTIISIGYNAFDGCSSLGSIIIPGSVKNIGSTAFANSGLRKVEFGCEDITFDDTGWMFVQCTNLKSVTVVPGSSAETYMSKYWNSVSRVEGKHSFKYTAESKKYVCDLCGKVVDRLPDTYCIPKVDAVSLSLSTGEIGVNLRFVELGSLIDTGAYVSINGIKNTISSPNADGKWVYTFNVSAKEMADKIKIEVFDKDDKKISWSNASEEDGSFCCTVVEYLNVVKDEYAELGNFAKAMLDYGLCAQAYFGYNAPDSLPDITSVSDYSIYLATPTGMLPNGVEYLGSSLLLKSSTAIRHYFSVDTIENVTFTVDNVVKEPVVVGNVCYIEVADINAVNLSKAYVLKVSDGSNTYTMSYSALTYCGMVKEVSANEALLALADSLYWYNCTARIYFEFHEL